MLAARLAATYRRKGPRQATLPPPPDTDFLRGWTGERKVALTFDADWWHTPRQDVLNTLHAKGVQVTFFLTGRFIDRYPGFVQQLVRHGHETGNHTYHHPHLTRYRRDELASIGIFFGRQETLGTVTKQLLQAELQMTAHRFEAATGSRMGPLWRAPFGERNEEILRWAAELGYQHVAWTLDSLDWVADKSSWRYFTAAQIRRRMLNVGKGTSEGLSGSIILFHVGSVRNTDDQVDRELPTIIDTLQGRGYELVPVSALRRTLAR